ncbi:cobalt-precorrin-8 methylmutase [Romboutsia lituseburensis]|uniref:Precorrin-8X methylmutase n=1 Tax=Romboutsia lituseburensis DSM 797 TaxID=1121325 RepID=A0A1G9UB42_9FIRM|nr:cobalt-precorrin-8 methylmutase [Romboutsia lituseburensis]CEH35836.1 Cobalt-precorrin-8X methylmutase [Romboutsia lituseburensis]SDM57053.1 precorrin-8X methylmutase [Romboutsia lituseburensis DSM 797]
MEYIKNPMKIEEKSFEMIQDIIDEIRPGYEFKNNVEEKIIKRSIHTTADFEYLDILKISDKAVESIIDALKNNATVYTDTNMALSGINKKRLEALGCKYKCLVADEETAKLAKEKSITRSMAAVEIAAKEPGRKLFVFGNAPTALYKAMEMKNSNELELDAIVGVPVGFVGAAESKDELEKTEIPYIISKGRKGGSNLAAAIINAILYTM